MGGEHHAELMRLQSELSNAALKSAMSRDSASAADEEGPVAGLASGVRRVVRLNPLLSLAAAFLVGAVVGALLRPVRLRGMGREDRNLR